MAMKQRPRNQEVDLLIAGLSNDRVLGKSALDWYFLLKHLYFPEKDYEYPIADAVRSYGSGYFKIVIQALSPNGLVLNPTSEKKRAEEIESNRLSALGVCMVLREKAEPILPDLIALMNDRYWKDRYLCANAISAIGPKASPAIPMAMVDLTYEDPDVRRQGLTILGGVGGQSKEAVDTLIRYTFSDSEILVGAAIWELGHVMKSKDSDPELVDLAKDTLTKHALGHGERAFIARGILEWKVDVLY